LTGFEILIKFHDDNEESNLGLRATLHLTDEDAHSAALAGDVDGFFSYVYADANHAHWIDENPLDIDKAWHVIHFLVTGDRSDTLLLDGCQIPIGDGHFESHSSASVGKVFQAIDVKTATDLLNRSSWDELNEAGIYAGKWEEDCRPYLLEKITDFICKIAKTEAENRGLFVSIT